MMNLPDGFRLVPIDKATLDFDPADQDALHGYNVNRYLAIRDKMTMAERTELMRILIGCTHVIEPYFMGLPAVVLPHGYKLLPLEEVKLDINPSNEESLTDYHDPLLAVLRSQIIISDYIRLLNFLRTGKYAIKTNVPLDHNALAMEWAKIDYLLRQDDDPMSQGVEAAIMRLYELDDEVSFPLDMWNSLTEASTQIVRSQRSKPGPKLTDDMVLQEGVELAKLRQLGLPWQVIADRRATTRKRDSKIRKRYEELTSIKLV